jgi:hypothetical protein
MAPSVQRRLPIPIVVDAGVLDVDLVLPRGGSIEGTVVDDQGDPMEGVTVAAYLLTRNGYGLATPTGRERRTDDLGRYRMFELPPGEYVVVANLDAEASGLDRRARVGLARVFHPSVHDIDSASHVVLDADVELAGVDIEYGLTSVGRVTGRAYDSRGEPVADGFAMLAPRSRPGGAIDEPRFVMLGKDGTFTLANVVPGRYVLQVVADVGIGKPAEFAARPVVVAEIDPAPLSLRTAPLSSVSGRVLLERPEREGQIQAPMSPFVFRSVPADPDMAPSFEDGRLSGMISTSGTFVFNGLVGAARITPRILRDGWYVKSLTLGRTDLLSTDFDFGTAGQAFTNATIVLSAAGGVVEGRVTPPRNGPLRDAIVFVFSTERAWWAEPSQQVKSARTGQRGEFRVNGLPPGEYLVATADAGDTSVDFAQPGADFLQRLAARAQRIEIDEGETRAVTLDF